MDPSKLFVEFLFGMVGTGYFIYGKKAGKMLFLGCGLALGLFPYFVENWIALLLVGAGLVGLPFLIRFD
jgi:quinol-cytochrome oxidoreductase complex cytochrome b subunit